MVAIPHSTNTPMKSSGGVPPPAFPPRTEISPLLRSHGVWGVSPKFPPPTFDFKTFDFPPFPPSPKLVGSSRAPRRRIHQKGHGVGTPKVSAIRGFSPGSRFLRERLANASRVQHSPASSADDLTAHENSASPPPDRWRRHAGGFSPRRSDARSSAPVCAVFSRARLSSGKTATD